MRWTVDGRETRTTSNTASLIVAERLDVALAPGGAATADVVPVRLTNAGNGPESFAVAATVAGGGAVRVAIDRNGDGRFDPAVDTLLDNATPVLAAGATLPLLVLRGQGQTGGITVTAQATTGSGTPGTAFPGAGEGGGDAVVGPTGAAAQLALAARPGDATATPELVKTQSVRAPDGSSRAVSGAVITYTLAATFPGPATGARIDDPLPAGAVYVPGSLRLDDAPLTDAADRDAGDFDGARVAVTLGDIVAAVTRTVTFQVRLP